MNRSSPYRADDNELIARAGDGDREAFGALYERYVDRVYRHVSYLANDHHLAEDLTAQTFLNALEAIPRYEVRGVPFLAWLLRIAYNLTVNHKKLRQNGDAPLPPTLDIEGSLDPPESSYQARADGKRVWEGVRNLRKDQRQVIVMRFLDGLSYSDIAKVLGKKIGAVRVIHYRALCSLRSWLERDANRLSSDAQPVQSGLRGSSARAHGFQPAVGLGHQAPAGGDPMSGLTAP